MHWATKMGELKILELRDRAKKALKKRFDIKEFHRAVLENGSVPLPLLERYVDDYIEKCRSLKKNNVLLLQSIFNFRKM